jgi:uncharacterized protein YqgV (UPF0045/DUF77 family)
MNMPIKSELELMTTTCGEQHTQLMDWVKRLIENIGKHDAHIKTSLENQNEIFERLRNIQSALDQRTVININVDKQIEKLSTIAEKNQHNIEKLQLHVTNGLSDRTERIETSVTCLRECMEKFEQQRKLKEAVEEAGLPGFFRASWEDVKKKTGPAIIYIILGLLAYGFVKTVIFQELPFPNGINVPKMKWVDTNNDGLPDKQVPDR